MVNALLRWRVLALRECEEAPRGRIMDEAAATDASGNLHGRLPIEPTIGGTASHDFQIRRFAACANS